MSTKSKRTDPQLSDIMENAMKKHRLSITDLADRIGITRSYASLVFHGRRSPSPKLLGALERLVRMPSIYDLEDHAPRHLVNDSVTYRVTSPKSQYLDMSAEEIEKAIVEYARELPKESGTKKVITLSVLQDLTTALQSKLRR